MKLTVTTFGAALVAGMLGAGFASASTIDLTDPAAYSLNAAKDLATGTTVDGITWNMTPLPVGSKLTNSQAYDGKSKSVPYSSGAPKLDLTKDGIGVYSYGVKDSSGNTVGCDHKGDKDEISFDCEAVTIDFGRYVKVTMIQVLDLFGAETAKVYDAGMNLLGTISAIEPAGSIKFGGYADSGSSILSGWTTSLTFVAGPLNDSGKTDGLPDFALAAVTLAPVPVPAAGLLLLGGLGGLGALKRRRKA